MKVELNRFGVMCVTPENETEQYALSQWKEQAEMRISPWDRSEYCEDAFFRGSCLRIEELENVKTNNRD